METLKTQEALLDGRGSAVASLVQPSDPTQEPESRSGMRDRLMNRFLRWLYPNQRNASRHPEPPLVAYLGTIRASQAFAVGDISARGFFMITAERWLPGTVMPVTLQRTGTGESDPAASIVMESKVVRSGPDGVGFAFVLPERATPESDDAQLEGWGDKDALQRFLHSLKVAQRGEAQPEEAS